jgi:Bacterial Ig-like domain
MTAIKDPGTVILQPGQTTKIRIQAGQHLKVRKNLNAADPSDLQVADNLVATRHADSLHLRYADGSALQLDDFFTQCSSASVCSVNLANDNPDGIILSGDMASGNVAGSDGGILVYAHGQHDVLLSMAQGQSGVLGAFQALGDAPLLTYLPQSSDALAMAAMHGGEPGALGLAAAGLLVLGLGGASHGDTATANSTSTLTPSPTNASAHVPSVSQVTLSSATGAQHNTLNAGDVVLATVAMSEATTVTGTPTLDLTIGANVVQAHFVSGSGTKDLVFSYTILDTQSDANGISIAANSLTLGAGTLKSGAGMNALLSHGAVADNASFLVDTTAPTLTISSSASTLKAGETATMTFAFSEDPLNTFDASDIVATGGTLGALGGSGLSRTAVFTRTADLATGNTSISVAGSGYTDAAGNQGGNASTSVLFDATPLQTVAITSYTDSDGVGAAIGNFASGTSTNDTTPVLNGSLSAALGATEELHVFDGSTFLGRATVTGTRWTFVLPTLLDGSQHSYSAAVQDAALELGVGSDPFMLTVSAPYERMSNPFLSGNTDGWDLHPTATNGGIDNVTYGSSRTTDGIVFNKGDSVAGGSAYQTLTHLVVGQSYTVQYKLDEIGTISDHTLFAHVQDGALPNSGTVLASQTYDQLGVNVTYHSFTFTAASSTATLVFENPSSVNTMNSDLVLTQASVMTTDEATRHRATAPQRWCWTWMVAMVCKPSHRPTVPTLICSTPAWPPKAAG